jgi:hypothetical protein
MRVMRVLHDVCTAGFQPRRRGLDRGAPRNLAANSPDRQELVRRTGGIRSTMDLGVPRSTPMGRVGDGAQPVVGLGALDLAVIELRAEVLKLRTRDRPPAP